jgi:hypothetical protein
MLNKSEISNLFQLQLHLEMELHALRKSPEAQVGEIERLEQLLKKCEQAIERITRSL